MKNQNERFFRMLSVAVLGLLALAVVPTHSQADDVDQSELAEAMKTLPVEITAVTEVDDINAGRFDDQTKSRAQAQARTQVLMHTETAAKAGDATVLVPSPVKTTTISELDPNL